MILKDGDKLLPSYVPSEVPHREKQVQDVLQYFSNALDNPGSAGLKFYQIVGPVGSGKTVATLKFKEAMEEGAKRRGIKMKVVYVNPRQHGNTRLMIFRRIVQAIEPNIFSVIYSAEELLMEVLKYLNRSDKCRVLGIVFTARSTAYQNKLDEAELSSLGKYYVKFEAYNSQQVYDILERRSYEAIEPGAVGSNVLKYIADITSSPPVYGDIRYALSLLYNSCMLAQNRGDASVELDHVRTGVGVISPSLTEEELMYLPEDEKFILYAIAN